MSGPRSVLGLLSLFLVLATALCASETSTAPKGPTAAEALAKLVEGNLRFVTDSLAHPGQTSDRRVTVAAGQQPFAIVLTCADSRLAPEIIFDQGIGDLFVIRNAGNLLNDHVLGSMEYAVAHLHTPLVIVLGHTKCGAVSAAVAGGHAPGHIQSIVDSLEPAVAIARDKPGDTVDNAMRIAARLSASRLAQTGPILGDAVKSGRLQVLAARYDIETGQVEFLK